MTLNNLIRKIIKKDLTKEAGEEIVVLTKAEEKRKKDQTAAEAMLLWKHSREVSK